MVVGKVQKRTPVTCFSVFPSPRYGLHLIEKRRCKAIPDVRGWEARFAQQKENNLLFCCSRKSAGFNDWCCKATALNLAILPLFHLLCLLTYNEAGSVSVKPLVPLRPTMRTGSYKPRRQKKEACLANLGRSRAVVPKLPAVPIAFEQLPSFPRPWVDHKHGPARITTKSRGCGWPVFFLSLSRRAAPHRPQFYPSTRERQEEEKKTCQSCI